VEDLPSLKVETLLPRKADLFTPDSVPLEYNGPFPSDSRRESASAPEEHEVQPKQIEAESTPAVPTKKLTASPFPGPLRKMFFSGTKRPIPQARPKLVGLPAISNSSLPPVLTPAGEHPHGHGDAMLKPVVQTAAIPSIADSSPEEPTKAAEEEGSDERMQQHQRLRGHDDVRGYSHVAEDALHALAGSFHITHDHPMKKPAEPSLEVPHNTPNGPRLTKDSASKKSDFTSLEEPHNIPLPESPFSSIKGRSMEPSFHSVELPGLLLESRLAMTSSRASKISTKGSVKKEDEATESSFNNPLCRMRTYDGRHGWKYVETGREWIDRIVGHNTALKYSSQLTERPPRPVFNFPLQLAHDGSMASQRQMSDSGEPKQATVQFQEPHKPAEPLNKAIVDLEFLLRETLEIARQAAEADQSQYDRERVPRMTVAGDRRRSMAPPTKVAFVESDEEPSHSQFKKGRTDTPLRRFSLAMNPSESRRSSLGAIDPLPEEPSESSSTSSDHEKTPGQPGEHDFAYPSKPRSRGPTIPGSAKQPSKEEVRQLQRQRTTSLAEDATRAARKFIRRPTIQPRVSSLLLQDPVTQQSRRSSRVSRRETTSEPIFSSTEDDNMEMIQLGDPEKQEIGVEPRPGLLPRGSSHGHDVKSYMKSFRGDPLQDRERGSARKQPIARNWRTSRKRIAATVACMNTALLGVLIGIYAGEVPAIQYAVVDLHHYAILGNVFLYIGLAIPTLLCWPLPLLHGRKPYTLAALALLLPLQLPQGVAVANPLSRHHAGYRAMLLVTRGLSGLAFGIANINFQSTLLDLFGASLQSANPHQEVIHGHDVRRYGGGMGVWLGIWSWCSTGSIAVGFFIGTGIITTLTVMWGFWVALILTVFMIIINLVTPEVRRAKHRRSLLDVWTHGKREKRFQYGELTIHVHNTGAEWFGEELFSGLEISLKMLKQPGFAVLCLYIAWVYGQIVLVVVVSFKHR
jgi:MFS family permease